VMRSEPRSADNTTVITADQLSERSNLTHSQLMIWMGQQLEPESPLYNMALCFRFDGAIDPALFQSAFSKLVSYSDALRTVIDVSDGVPMQRVLDRLDYQVEIVDLGDEEDPQQALSDWIEVHNGQGFDLSRCSFESTLLLTGEGHSVWYLNQHHLTTDAWSVSLIYKNVADLYSASLNGEPAAFAELPAWADYVAFECDHGRGEAYKNAIEHWRQRAQLQIDPVCFYSRKPVTRCAATRRVACPLGESRTRRLKEMALSDGIRGLNINITLFNIFLGVLSGWLYRISDSRKMAIGAPAHNRSSLAFRETIGLFIEIFPLHIEHEDGQTFRDLLGRVATETQSWLRHAQPGTGSMAGTRQFNVVLNYIHATFAPFAGIPVEAEWIHTGYSDPGHDLRLQVHDFGDSSSLLLYFDFNQDTFSEALQERAISHFMAMLDAFISNPDCRIDRIALATEQERQQNLVDYNQTAVPMRSTTTVLDLFRKQCLKTADVAAILLGDRQISYTDLDRRSNNLAALLQERGVTSGALVGIYLTRSIEMIVAILGVLKAGAGYVPLESRLPAVRLEYILRDTGVRMVLTESGLVDRLNHHNVDSLCMDREAVTGHHDKQADVAVGPGDIAYVIYTSGSTGQPKGVVIEHRGLHEYICWAGDAFAEGLPLNFALHSNFGFDLTVTSLFVPLTCGGAIVIYPEEDVSVDISILRVFEDNRCDIVKLTPAHLRLVLTMDVSSSRVSRLILGGEDLKTELCNRASTAFSGDIIIYNEYGPTEGVVGCMIHRFDPAVDKERSVPIGTPAANTRIYVLDAGLNPVPQGAIGEIYVCRPGLARGYLGRDELTTERFIDDPFFPGQRMYSTGDLARFRADSVMEYLGRTDEQVKIRGVRIELAEVEHALLVHPDIEQCTLQVIQPDSVPEPHILTYCTRCGLASNYPGVSFDSAGVCNTCIDYDSYKNSARTYFRTMEDLRTIFEQVKRESKGDYDCLVLLSGGKDSTYALAQVVAMGLKVLAFTLDNGFISDGAKGNISRVVADLGVDHVFGHTPDMNAIFVDSLERHSNVCQGCFKVIYTLSMQLAVERNIACIVTGLSRGQFFETRLTADLFRDDCFDIDSIDQMVLDARKAYHRVDDAVSRLMDVSLFQDEQIFNVIRFVDFYRYCDVDLTEMLAFLNEKLPWIRPADTGRSTNCLINDIGIHVHKRKQHFHNYALPYSWDVRLGVKQRAEALDELDDDIDVSGVYRILNEIHYDEDSFFADSDEKRLAAYYTASKPLTVSGLKQWLGLRLPAAIVPGFLVQLDEMPLTENGKVDRCALPDPREQRPQLEQAYCAPRTDLEEALVGIWGDALGVRRIGIHDNYFDLGGDSIVAIQIVGRANAAGIRLAPNELFLHQTIAGLAAVARPARKPVSVRSMEPGPVPLTPIQHWFFAQQPPRPDHFNQSVLLDVNPKLDAGQLDLALQQLLSRHAALRMRFWQHDGVWMQELPKQSGAIELQRITLPTNARECERLMQRTEARMNASLHIADGKLVAAVLFEPEGGQTRQLMLIIHHLVVDAVSWLFLLEDLDISCKQLAAGQAVNLPALTSSSRSWAQSLQRDAVSPATLQEQDYWLSAADGQAIQAPPADILEATRHSLSVILPAELTQRLLDQASSAWHMQMHEFMLAALAMTLAAHTGRREINISLESHGREEIDADIDTSRTVGWFTALYPVAVHIDTSASLDDTLQAVRQRLREVPRHGIGYGLLGYPGRGHLAEPSSPWGGVLMNYMGRTGRLLREGSWLRFARPLRVSRAADNRICFTWEINAWLGEDGLHVDWDYSDSLHSEDEVGKLARALLARLRSIAECSIENTTATGSSDDFPLAGLDQDQLGKLAALLKRD
jgi:amino acid adenylation domain-containing protein/non-ribosomal peptide synthase protein (TIGR01720 family)